MKKKEESCPICPLKLYNTVKERLDKHIPKSLLSKFNTVKEGLKDELDKELKKNGINKKEISRKLSQNLNKLENLAQNYSETASKLLTDLAKTLKVSIGKQEAPKQKKKSSTSKRAKR